MGPVTNMETNQSSNSWLTVFDNLTGDIDVKDTQHLLEENGFVKNNVDVFTPKEFENYVYKIHELCIESFDKHIYEIGCGNGLFVSTLAQISGISSYGGSDISPSKISKAKHIWPQGQWYCCEAIDDTNIAGFLLLNSVLQYFPNQSYLERFIELISKKEIEGVAFLDVPIGRSESTDFIERGNYNGTRLQHLRISPDWLKQIIEDKVDRVCNFELTVQTPLTYHDNNSRFNLIWRND
jgi:hypothetical protein